MKGDNEMTIAELRRFIAEDAKVGGKGLKQRFTVHQKFSIPVACFVLALIGAALGVNNRKEGKRATIALGVAVSFAYYIVLYASRGAAFAGRLTPELAPWIANIVLGVAGIALVIWRAGAADQPIRLPLPAFPRRRRDDAPIAGASPRRPAPRG